MADALPSPADIDKLDRLMVAAGGHQTIRCILGHLRAGRRYPALLVRQSEGDKTREYPEIEAHLYKMFGCRLHGNHGCGEWLCEAPKTHSGT